MKKPAGVLLGYALFLGQAACFGQERKTTEQYSLASQARAILQAHCAACHGGGKASKGGFGFLLDRDQLVSRLLVAAGKPDQSELFVRVKQGDMPPKDRPQRPSAAEVEILKRWIDAGAPPFDEATRVKAPAETDVPGLILADLEQLDPRRVRFTRYLTLAHLGVAGRPEKDLETTREAAAKLLNSLSWQAHIRIPASVAHGLVLRIDLRDYKWPASLWEKLAAAYPYRLGAESESVRRVAKLTGSEAAFLRADWFVALASRPPLYHDLLQLPTTDRALERLLQVDVPTNIQEDNVIRAGFNDSGVSKNNRLIERHDAVHGALWRGYDFEKNTGRQNLFEHPLGPNTGATSFQAAGGEIIFHLPNGLHGYLLVDSQGRRIDKAPGEIVADARRPDQRVVNGLSCMACHARGLLPKLDQLRPHVEKNAQVFGKPVVDAVRALHPRKAAFQARMDEDNARYSKALKAFGLRDPDQEPINLVTQRFEATLDGNSAAAELGLSVVGLGLFLKQHPDLARLLGGTLVAGGTVQREVFEENFPEMARRLRAFLAAKTQQKEVTPFHGHTAAVNCVAFSPDGKHAASGSDDRTIRIWEIAGGRQAACLQGESAEIYALAFSRDGKFLLSGGRDKLVRLWDVAAAREVRGFRGHTDAVRCVAFSPDDKEAASGGDDRVVRTWHVAGGVELGMGSRHDDAITSVAWSHDGRYLLSGGRDGIASLWYRPNSERKAVFHGHAGPVLTVAFVESKKKMSILTGGNDRTVRLWTLEKGRPVELHCFKGHANAVIQLQVLGGRNLFLSSSSQHQNPDRAWRSWELKQRTEVNAIAPPQDVRFGCAAFSPDGRRAIVGGPGGYLRVFDTRFQLAD